MAAIRVRQLGVPGHDADAVAVEALADLQPLRPELLARYALRQRDYDDWVQQVASVRRQ